VRICIGHSKPLGFAIVNLRTTILMPVFMEHERELPEYCLSRKASLDDSEDFVGKQVSRR